MKFDDETTRLIEDRFVTPVQESLPDGLKVETEPIRYEPEEFEAVVYDYSAEPTGRKQDRRVIQPTPLSVVSLRSEDDARILVDRFVNDVLERWKGSDA